MIYPPHGGGSGSAGASSTAGAASTPAIGPKARRMRGGSKKVVQWRQQNVQHGVVIVDEAQLCKLIKREPIEKFYDLDPAPFATGMFASVRRCRSRENGQLFAAKFCSRVRYGEDCSAEIHHELTLLSLCSPSPRIVRLHDVFETPSEVILVLEYAPGGDLQTIIDDNMVPFEEDVLKFVRQVVEGLSYIHERKIVHLDIKPQNLVMMGPFPDCDIKLCDFEISRVILEGAEVREILGTPDYVAPEIIHYEPITLAADMWSLGVTVYVLLTGFSPFGGDTDQETFSNISRCEPDFPPELFEDVSPEAQDFVARLLVRQPSARMTSKECLRHPWLAKKSPRTSVTSHLPPGSVTTGHSSRRSESPVHQAGGSAAAQKNLRKYLSKSREALFEKVSGSNLRKTISKSRERLCESHLSLVSKSRERLLMLEPSSRSIEKLYGLRSLSKSQDALSAQEMLAINPVLAAQHLLRCQSEATSLGRDAADTSENKEKSNTGDSVKPAKIPRDRTISDSNLFSLPTTPSSLTSETTIKVSCNTLPQSIANTNTSDSNTSKPVIKSEIKNLKNNTSTLNTVVSNITYEKCVKTEIKETKSTSPRVSKKLDASLNKQLAKDENNKENHEKREISKVNITESGMQLVAEADNNKLSRFFIEDTTQNDETGSDSSDKTIRERSPGLHSSEEDEPRYSVAQLVSAYNKNDQIAATSAMTYDRNIPSKLKFVSRFPTGPNALRLFIPDIMISERKQLSPGISMKECTPSPDSSLSPAPSMEEHCAVDEANNNNTECLHNNTDCQLLKVPESQSDAVVLARSASLSSEASGYDTLSGASSLVSLEENSTPTNLTQSKSETKIPQRPRSSSLHGDTLRPPWGTVCTGSYSRAMERFNNKNNLIHQPNNQQRQRRKSSPIIKSPTK